MSQAVRVKDLFELPEHLSKSAFVLKLAEGVEEVSPEPEESLGSRHG